MKLLPRLLADEEEGDEPQSQVDVVKPEAHRHFWAWTATLAAVAAVPRLLYMFVFSNPENPGPYGDGQATVEESKQLGGWYNEPGYNGHALAVPPRPPRHHLRACALRARRGEAFGKRDVRPVCVPALRLSV